MMPQPQAIPQQGPASPQPEQGAPPGGPPVTIDAVVQLLRDDEMRGFRIDVETDSMVEADQESEKKSATEFVTAVGQYLTQLGPIVQVMPPLAPLVGGMLQWSCRRFKVGQELEDLIEKTMASVSTMLGQPKPPPPPNPDELVKLEGTKAKVAAEIQKAQIGVQQTQIEAQGKIQQARMQQHGDARQAAMDQHASTQQAVIDHVGGVSKANREQAQHELEMQKMYQERQFLRDQHDMKMKELAAQAKAKETP